MNIPSQKHLKESLTKHLRTVAYSSWYMKLASTYIEEAFCVYLNVQL